MGDFLLYFVKKEIKDIKEKVFIEPVKEKLFFDGSFFDAYEFFCSLLTKADSSVLIIDPYFDLTGLSLLKKVDRTIARTICLSNKAQLSKEDIKAFRRQYGDVTLIRNDSFHDRFLILDNNDCYSLGASLNYMGKKVFAVNKIEDLDIIRALLNKINK